MTWLSGFSPVSSFPHYHGPHDVGTVDVEIPASDLKAPCSTPEDAQPTIAFRIFYPCIKPSTSEHQRPVRWIPQPQKPTAAALFKFLGLKDRTAGALSYLTQQFYWINIQAYRNSKILEPSTRHGRWPVAVFSHGLAGSRNAYSYICGNMASNGMIVIAMDHRDGSSPTQYVRATADTEARTVDAIKVSHEATEEVWEARDKQLRIRAWEISMAYEALLKIDNGEEVENLDMNTSSRRKERVEVLKQFGGKLDIHRPGKVSWVGHSFGAATVAQLVKSTYYSAERPESAGKPLISPSKDAAIAEQITADSPTMLLDTWGLPLKSPSQAFLWERPLPSYASDGPQGENVLSILSEGFHNWKTNLEINKSIVSTTTTSRKRTSTSRLGRGQTKPLPSWARLRDEQSPSQDSGYASQDSSPRRRRSSTSVASSLSPSRSPQGPYMFYVARSQHFSQSDFGILFPWVTKRMAKADDPEEILYLNTRAIVQVMRANGIEVAGEDDEQILRRDGGGVDRWVAVPVDAKRDGNEEDAMDVVKRKLSMGAEVPPAEDGALAA